MSVSCPRANKFSAILFLLLARSSSNSPRSLEGFRRTLKQNLIQIRQRVRNFSMDPRGCYNVAESGQFLQWGSIGIFFICCRNQLTFRHRVRLKRCNDWREFELHRARSKINIAENSFVLGHETDNNVSFLMSWLRSESTLLTWSRSTSNFVILISRIIQFEKSMGSSIFVIDTSRIIN